MRVYNDIHTNAMISISCVHFLICNCPHVCAAGSVTPILELQMKELTLVMVHVLHSNYRNTLDTSWDSGCVGVAQC